MSHEVSVSRSLLAALVVALVLALVAVAFLLGRATAPASPPVTTAPSPASVPSAPAVGTAVTEAEVPTRRTLPLSTEPAAPPPAASPVITTPPAPQPRVVIEAPSRPAPRSADPPSQQGSAVAQGNTSIHVTASTSGGATTAAVDPAMRAQVQSYFHDIDNIQPGQLSGDPQTAAQEMLQGAMTGDTRQLDEMVARAEASERRMRAIRPPPPCAAFHQRAMALTSESVRMMHTMRQGLVSGDTTALLGLSTQAAGMQQQAEALQREEEMLKQRYR